MGAGGSPSPRHPGPSPTCPLAVLELRPVRPSSHCSVGGLQSIFPQTFPVGSCPDLTPSLLDLGAGHKSLADSSASVPQLSKRAPAVAQLGGPKGTVIVVEGLPAAPGPLAPVGACPHCGLPSRLRDPWPVAFRSTDFTVPCQAAFPPLGHPRAFPARAICCRRLRRRPRNSMHRACRHAAGLLPQVRDANAPSCSQQPVGVPAPPHCHQHWLPDFAFPSTCAVTYVIYGFDVFFLYG